MRKFFLIFFSRRFDYLGKTAMAKEIPIIPMGTYWRLFAKLKIAILPTAKLEAIAVITT